ncbi:MAG: outer membrane beta-barrel protein [Kiritimatiellaeota bacterium]|nr:outer membrane beta-barrel protein [Kiritimatiellota bacterium]
MKRLVTMLAVIGLCASSAWASGLGAYGAYWKSKGGNEAFDGDGFGGGAKLKLDLAPMVSLEVRGTYFSLKPKESGVGDEGGVGAKLEVIPVEAGLVLNLVNQSKVLPYIGGGAGYFFMKAKGDVDDSTKIKSEIGGYVVAGLEIELGEGLALFAEGKYTMVSIKEVDSVKLPQAIKLDGFGGNAGLMMKW